MGKKTKEPIQVYQETVANVRKLAEEIDTTDSKTVQAAKNDDLLLASAQLYLRANKIEDEKLQKVLEED